MVKVLSFNVGDLSIEALEDVITTLKQHRDCTGIDVFATKISMYPIHRGWHIICTYYDEKSKTEEDKELYRDESH